MQIASLSKQLTAFSSRITLALGLMFAGLSALHAEEATGTIADVDYDNGLIILDDGSTLILPEDFDVEAFEAGQTIHVTYDLDSDGNMIATDLELAD